MARKNDFTINADKIIGERIRELRINKGLSRNQLAEQIGVSHQQLQKYEKSLNRIAATRLFLVAKAFKVPVSYFMDELDSEYVVEPTQHSRMTIEIARNFQRIENSKEQYAVNQLVRILAAN